MLPRKTSRMQLLLDSFSTSIAHFSLIGLVLRVLARWMSVQHCVGGEYRMTPLNIHTRCKLHRHVASLFDVYFYNRTASTWTWCPVINLKVALEAPCPCAHCDITSLYNVILHSLLNEFWTALLFECLPVIRYSGPGVWVAPVYQGAFARGDDMPSVCMVHEVGHYHFKRSPGFLASPRHCWSVRPVKLFSRLK